MLREAYPHEEFVKRHENLNEEFVRCSHILNLFEQHGITFLTTANGGGAATVIGFAGSAQYVEGLPIVALASFLLGMVFVGLAIAFGHTRLASVCEGLSKDHASFNSNQMGLNEVYSNHHERFARWRYGVPSAYASAGGFLAGILFSICAFFAYPEWKTEKDAKAEVAKKVVETPLNVSCVTPNPAASSQKLPQAKSSAQK